jgi:uncharacterized protein (DUF2141 family)
MRGTLLADGFGMAPKIQSILLVGAALANLAVATSSSFAQGPAPARDIVVVVEGLRNSRGSLVGAIYTSPDHWLEEGAAHEDCHARIRGGVARCVFSVPHGTRVAFAGLHDEDDDGVFDRDFFGMPQEGYAFSNDVREPFGPPSFAAASFVPAPVAPFVVHVRYGI